LAIEKSDVIIDKLFNWGKEFSIKDNKGNEVGKVYVRLVGDAEINRSRVFALRRSAELRRSLNNLESDESLAFIPEKGVVEKDNLVELTIVYTMRDLAREANQAIDLPYPTEPTSDAPLEDQEKYQALVDNYPKKRDELYRKQLDKFIERERTRLKKLDLDGVYSEFRLKVINDLCENEMIKKFNEFNAYLGSYSDSEFKHKLFKSHEDFERLPTELKNQFLAFYSELDIDTEELKK
jgi:hypothetical protein